MLPRTAPVIMRGKAGNGKRALFERSRKLGMEHFGGGGFDLVLDGDMEARAGLILRY